MFVQAFGSYDLQHSVHSATEKYAEQSHRDDADHDDVADKANIVNDEVGDDFIILPLLAENHEYSRVVIARLKAVAATGENDNSNDSDNHSTAVLTDNAYGRAFSPPLVAADFSPFHSRFSQRDLFLQTHRLRI